MKRYELRTRNILILCMYMTVAPLPAHAKRDGEERHYFHESFSVNSISNTNIDWQQPPLGCVEEMVPSLPNRACLDLSGVVDPLRDWPVNLSPDDKEFWYSHRRWNEYCRAVELLKRSTANPDGQSPGDVEYSWMTTDSVRDSQTKVDAIYEANKTLGVPLQVLTGAIFQESAFSELGIAYDGGNYSCGIEQANLSDWCSWANKQSDTDKATIDWPFAAVSCNDSSIVNLDFIAPFYKIAVTRLNESPGIPPPARALREYLAERGARQLASCHPRDSTAALSVD